nr:23S rRNA (adenine(2030)-N(6))-methyltransferase RlmJ [Aestuariicella hydrocarbonica]
MKKDKAIVYIDTHSGAGLFNLRSQDAEKLEEYRNGIGKLVHKPYPEMASYLELVKSFNKPNLLSCYPGSPMIAAHFLRPQDKAWLYELHPQDYKALKGNIQATSKSARRKISVVCQDGLQGVLSQLPPASRRGLVLIDPSYEVKSEYDKVASVVGKAYKKFSTGIFAIWYPVVEREKIHKLEKKLVASGIRNIQKFELGLQADSKEHGMTAAGMIVINPPWGLYDKMSSLLPKLTKALGNGSADAFYKCETLVGE